MQIHIGICVYVCLLAWIFNLILTPGKHLLLKVFDGREIHRLAEEQKGEDKMDVPMFPHGISKQLGKCKGLFSLSCVHCTQENATVNFCFQWVGSLFFILKSFKFFWREWESCTEKEGQLQQQS